MPKNFGGEVELWSFPNSSGGFCGPREGDILEIKT